MSLHAFFSFPIIKQLFFSHPTLSSKQAEDSSWEPGNQGVNPAQSLWQPLPLSGRSFHTCQTGVRTGQVGSDEFFLKQRTHPAFFSYACPHQLRAEAGSPWLKWEYRTCHSHRLCPPLPALGALQVTSVAPRPADLEASGPSLSGWTVPMRTTIPLPQPLPLGPLHGG